MKFKNKGLLGLVAIFFGAFGLHNLIKGEMKLFYFRVIFLVVIVVLSMVFKYALKLGLPIFDFKFILIPVIWGIIDGIIIMLSGTIKFTKVRED